MSSDWKNFTGPILDIRGMGAFFGANVFKKGLFCLLAPPNQMSFLTIISENVFPKIRAPDWVR